MGGSFRVSPPALPTGMIERPRLARRLDERWHRRLVTVVAGPGFGKTSALTQAVARSDRSDRDVWLTCASVDSDGDSLLADLGAALGLPVGCSFDDIVSTTWMAAPAQVCFVLDDVHEIRNDSTGVRLLARLVDELPTNGHVVLSSRSAVPVPVARLAARQQLERIVEDDLLFDDEELRSFADVRGIERSLLGSSQGWPALAALVATAADDLVYDYVWEEVLATLGRERLVWLARLDAIGGADEELLARIAPSLDHIDDLVAGVPLVERRVSGWVALHPLWRPILRTVLASEEAAEVRRAAASVHRHCGRFDAAIDLYEAAGAWDDVIETIRMAELDAVHRTSGRTFGRWAARLPPSYADHPVRRFASALDVASQLPAGALPELAASVAAFRSTGDVEGELAALNEYGFELWWASDVLALIGVITRVRELAEQGHAAAGFLVRIGEAGVAHINADSAGVLAALAGIDERAEGAWASGVAWLRHVAHRRVGDLDRAELALDAVPSGSGSADPQMRLARHRTDWLRGRVGQVPAGIRSVHDHYVELDNRYLRAEAGLELAAKLAWLGEADEAAELLAALTSEVSELPGTLARILWLIGAAALAVASGDERRAEALLASDECCEPGRGDNWYWRDRCAVALPYVLLPDQRDAWSAVATAPAHRVGVELARALVACRVGDASAVRALTWPDPGIARAHLPSTWLSELAAGAAAAGNPAPPALISQLGGPARDLVQLRLRVLGPMTVRSGDQALTHADLRRQRVRELLAYLVVHPRARRDAVADALWPDLSDPRHNLRVTLNYLQRALDACSPSGSPGCHLHADRESIGLVESSVSCDLWELGGLLGAAASHERAGRPREAVEALDRALAIWTGPPFEDVVGSDWIRDEQTRWRDRLGVAALRCGELHLAAAEVDGARVAGETAISNDPTDERAYQLLARAHIANGDPARARRTLDACIAMLDDLGVGPADATEELMARLTDR